MPVNFEGGSRVFWPLRDWGVRPLEVGLGTVGRRWGQVTAVLLGLAALSQTGCPNASSFTTARAIGHGNNEVALGTAVVGGDIGFLAAEDTAAETRFIRLNADFSYRHGFGDWFDFGVRLTGLGQLSADFKFELFDSEFFTIALDPEVGGALIASVTVDTSYVQFALPLLMDFHLADWATITLGGRYGGVYRVDSPQAGPFPFERYTHWAGATAAIRLRINRELSIVPYGAYLSGVGGQFNDDPMALWSGGIGLIAAF